jgi:hypothetical protein
MATFLIAHLPVPDLTVAGFDAHTLLQELCQMGNHLERGGRDPHIFKPDSGLQISINICDHLSGPMRAAKRRPCGCLQKQKLRSGKYVGGRKSSNLGMREESSVFSAHFAMMAMFSKR